MRRFLFTSVLFLCPWLFQQACFGDIYATQLTNASAVYGGIGLTSSSGYYPPGTTPLPTNT